jgi:hypothetical protein
MITSNPPFPPNLAIPLRVFTSKFTKTEKEYANDLV